jgi:O-antigen ligase
MLLILKTVSREGLLLALVVFILALLRVSAANKVKLIAAGMTLCLVAAFTLSRESLDRYLTLFTSSVSTSEAAASATASSRMRHQKLMESIELTLRHPIFGVGMGVFMPASVEIAKERGGHLDWEVSHNSYTQVSSELGLPGLLLLLALYATGFRQILRINGEAKRAGRDDVRQMAFALLIALTVLCVHFCFDSMAYVFYMPLILGLIAAFAKAYGEPDSLVPAEAATPVELRQIHYKEPEIPAAVSAASRNPYRFGRRR